MTPRQHSVLRAIEELTVDGVGPSMEEIRKRTGLASRGNVHRVIQDLKGLGLIRQPLSSAGYQSRARSYEILGRDVTDADLSAMSSDALLGLSARVSALLEARA